MVPGQYNLVLLGIKWNWASTRLLCLYILKKKVEIWSDVSIVGGTTNKRTRKDRATQPMDHGRLRWAKRKKKIYIFEKWASITWCLVEARNMQTGEKLAQSQ